MCLCSIKKRHLFGYQPFAFACFEATEEEVATKLTGTQARYTAAKAASKKGKDVANTAEASLNPATGDTPVKSPPKKVSEGNEPASNTSPEGSESRSSNSTVQRRLRFKEKDPDPAAQIKALQEADMGYHP